MSAPTPAPGDDRPREGYYPDPSIPGYVRYWNGAAWVPGTSRPAPSDGEPLASPPGSAPAPSPVEETGPHFFDEDPEPAPSAQHGSRPEPAAAWGADRAHQSGFGDDQNRLISWGADPRVPHPTGNATSTDGTATIPPADAGAADVPSDGTFVFRRPTATGGGGAGAPGSGGPGTLGASGAGGTAGSSAAGRPGNAGASGAPGVGGSGVAGASGAPGVGGSGVAGASGAPGVGGSGVAGAAASGTPGAGGPGGRGAARPTGAAAPGANGPSTPGIPAPGGPIADEGTMTFRALAPRTGQHGGAQDGDTGAPGFGAGKAAADRAAAAQSQARPAAGAGPQSAASPAPSALPGPQQPAPALPQQSSGPQSAPVVRTPVGRPPVAPPQAPVPTPMTSGPGGGQPSWAQQVHRLAGAAEDEQPVAPWKPPVEDVFTAAARRQSAARPAGLGKRLLARIIDNLVLGAATAVAAVPLGTKAADHINEKIDAARLSGETVTVWLLDGTTTAYLGIVLAVLLVFGVLYEALPTAKWGRTLGKKLLGLEVRDIEAHQPPSFAAALRRWLVYSVPGLLGIGVVGVLWCLFDRPWHQCWHDKAAGTFVAG